MKRLPAGEAAMTLIEVLVVIAVVAMVISMVLPLRHRPYKTPAGECSNNLRQIDLGFLLYAGDNHGKYPIQFSITNGGTREFVQRNQTFPQYQKVWEYYRTLGILVCPTDKNRRPAADYKTMADTNLSYFLNADVSTNHPASSILAGDRNLEANGRPVPPGQFSMSTNMDLGFTRELHLRAGVLAFADGHVEFCRATDLNTRIKRQDLPTARFSVP